MIDGIDFLQLLWFLLIGLLFMIFYFTEGFDYGVGMATQFLAKNDQEKHVSQENNVKALAHVTVEDIMKEHDLAVGHDFEICDTDPKQATPLIQL